MSELSSVRVQYDTLQGKDYAERVHFQGMHFFASHQNEGQFLNNLLLLEQSMAFNSRPSFGMVSLFKKANNKFFPFVKMIEKHKVYLHT